MTEAKHTPGPWKATTHNEPAMIRRWWITANITEHNGEKDICDLVDSHGIGAANARLIAAAPELLEALKGAIEWMACVEPHLHDGQPFQRNLESYKAAIAKATGEGR